MKNHLTLVTRATVVALTAGAFCLSTNAFAQQQERTANQETKSSTASPAAKASSDTSSAKTSGGPTGQLSSADRDFMMQAAKGGMMEVEMGQMAQKQAQNADVKKLADTLVSDHTKANNQLMGIAQKKGVKLDAKPKMDKMSGSNFDEQYLSTMEQDHQKTINLFQTEAKNGSDADVKAFANKTLPTLQKHLKMVKDTQGKMKKA
jgi:putative membrane protein